MYDTCMTLNIEQLNIGYSGFSLCSEVSFTLKSGEALTITGQNGIGKSTLLATVAGVLSPLEGVIHNQFSTMLYLTLNKPIFPTLSVEENVNYWSLLCDGNDQSVHQALRYFKLDALRDEPCSHLSAGQLQRLHLCRLILTDAQLWLLDEPYHSLDDEGCNLLNELITNHLQGGGAVLFAQTMAPFIGKELNLHTMLRAA